MNRVTPRHHISYEKQHNRRVEAGGGSARCNCVYVLPSPAEFMHLELHLLHRNHYNTTNKRNPISLMLHMLQVYMTRMYLRGNAVPSILQMCIGDLHDESITCVLMDYRNPDLLEDQTILTSGGPCPFKLPLIINPGKRMRYFSLKNLQKDLIPETLPVACFSDLIK